MNHLGLTLPLKVFGSANDASRQMAALWTGGAPSLMLEQARRLGQRLPLGETYAALMQGCVEHGESDFDNGAVINEIRRRRGAPGG